MDPPLPEEVTEQDLPFAARAELKSLTKENATFVARHLAMAGLLIEADPELAHEHALSASRRGGRIAVVRETLAITAYTTGDFALALRELRTYRRISGRDDQLALMIDSERGLGRPDRALEIARSVDLTALPAEQRAQIAIALSGARLDQGKTELALAELEIPQLDAHRAFSYSPVLFTAYADVLEELGRQDESERWRALAARAEQALDEARHDEREIIEVHSEELRGEELEAFYEAHPEARPDTTAADSHDAIRADAGEDATPDERGAALAEAAGAEEAGGGVPSDENGAQLATVPEVSSPEGGAEAAGVPAADADGETAGDGVPSDEDGTQLARVPEVSSPAGGAEAAGVPAADADGPEDAGSGEETPAADGAGARVSSPERDAEDLAAAQLLDLEAEVEELLAEPNAGAPRADGGSPAERGPGDEAGSEGDADASGSDRGDDGDGPIVVETTLFDL